MPFVLRVSKMKVRSLAFIFIRLAVISILPFSLLLDRPIGYACLLFNVGNPLLGFNYYNTSQNIIAFALFLLYLSPSLVFNYKLNHSSDDQSVTKYLVAAFVFGFSILPFLMTDLIIFNFAGIYGGLLSFIVGRALLAAQWGFFLFVIIPFLLHESSKLRKEQENYTQVKATRYDLIAIILGMSICFLPFAISFGYINFPHTRFQVMLLSGIAIYQYTPLLHPTLSILLATPLYFPLCALTNIVTFCFAYYIMKYLQGSASRNSCLFIGLIAFILSPFAAALVNLYHYGFVSILFPLPLTLLIGTMILFAAKPKISVSEDIFSEKSHSNDTDGSM